jgi:hypothetical protein
MEPISWTNGVNDEVLERTKEVRNFLHKIEAKKGDWIGHIVRSNIIKLKIDRKIKRTGRRGRRGKQLLDE